MNTGRNKLVIKKQKIPIMPKKLSELNNDTEFITEQDLSSKQDVLVSGTNIKTINSASLLGSGDIAISNTPEGTAVKSTGEVGGTKFLREDGDGTCSWQATGALINIVEDTTPQLGGNLDTQGNIILGGTGTTADLTLQTTSGVGAAGADMHFKVGNNGATEAITILNSGAVGIGTTTQYTILNVVGAQYSSAYRGNLTLQDSAAVAIDIGGGVLFGGSYSGTTKTIWAGISGLKEDGTAGNYGGYLSFWTRPHGGANSEKVRILSSGNVGIGITAPTAKLHLPACAAAANTASLKIDAGTVATVPVSGNIESDGTHLYWTDSGGTRKQLDN